MYYCNNTISCAACPAGKFSPPGSTALANCTTPTTSAPTTTPVPITTQLSTVITDAYTGFEPLDCVACAAGEYLSRESLNCTACPAGSGTFEYTTHHQGTMPLEDGYAGAEAFLAKLGFVGAAMDDLLVGVITTDDGLPVPAQVKKGWQKWNLTGHPDKQGDKDVYNTMKAEYTAFKRDFEAWQKANPTGQPDFQTYCLAWRVRGKM
jgi:hypothetical protein